MPKSSCTPGLRSLCASLAVAAVLAAGCHPASATDRSCRSANWTALETGFKKLANYRGKVRFDRDEVIAVAEAQANTRCGVYLSLPEVSKQIDCLSTVIDRSKALADADSTLNQAKAFSDGVAALVALNADGFKLDIDKPYVTFTTSRAGKSLLDDVADDAGSQPDTTGVSASALGHYLARLSALNVCRLADLPDLKLVGAIAALPAQ